MVHVWTCVGVTVFRDMGHKIAVEPLKVRIFKGCLLSISSLPDPSTTYSS
jgi:hypothetical protein